MQMRLSPAALLKRADAPESSISVGWEDLPSGKASCVEGKSDLLTLIPRRERECPAGSFGQWERGRVTCRREAGAVRCGGRRDSSRSRCGEGLEEELLLEVSCGWGGAFLHGPPTGAPRRHRA